MAYINDEDRAYLVEELGKLPRPVTLRLFVGEECQTCDVAKELMEELVGLSGKLALSVHDLDAAPEAALAYGIDKVPALVVEGERDYGIRFFGLPSGYEFASLIEDIQDVAAGDTDLPEDIRAGLAGIERDVHIQVFVTPSCPYCPLAVRTAHKFALHSERIRADMVMANEFPVLADHYQVMAVPKVVINGFGGFEGALPEQMFLDKILERV